MLCESTCTVTSPHGTSFPFSQILSIHDTRLRHGAEHITQPQRPKTGPWRATPGRFFGADFVTPRPVPRPLLLRTLEAPMSRAVQKATEVLVTTAGLYREMALSAFRLVRR